MRIIIKLYLEWQIPPCTASLLEDPFTVQTRVHQVCILSPTNLLDGDRLGHAAVDNREEDRDPVDLSPSS
jgi:hypothetical protein